jgi:hypothetical protein
MRSMCSDPDRISAPVNSQLRHLLLIAGPGGAGKSTFIDMLRSGQLPPHIGDLLPPGSQGWSHAVTKDLRANDDKQLAANRDGLILHYCTSGAHLRKYGTYAGDPILELLATSESITLVNVRPSVDILLEQYRNRTMDGRTLVGRMLRRGPQRLMRSYRQKNWVQNLYQRWDSFIESAVPKGKLRIVNIEPDSSVAAPSFRLC